MDDDPSVRKRGQGHDEAILPAWLSAMPEVQTCVRCQDRLERRPN